MMKILTVDDSKTFQIALAEYLLHAGYADVVKRNSAKDAIYYLLETVSSSSTIPKVDIVLMDLTMPGMDGIEAVRVIKGYKHLRDIPIVMISAIDREDKINEAFDAGAVDFISKPVKKLELLARVRSVLKLKSEMDKRKAREKELEETVDKLQQSLDEIRTLSGLLPICAYCKKIRDDKGYWQQVESYFSQRSDASFSHSICPGCLHKHYPKQAKKLLESVAANHKD